MTPVDPLTRSWGWSESNWLLPDSCLPSKPSRPHRVVWITVRTAINYALSLVSCPQATSRVFREPGTWGSWLWTSLYIISDLYIKRKIKNTQSYWNITVTAVPDMRLLQAAPAGQPGYRYMNRYVLLWSISTYYGRAVIASFQAAAGTWASRVWTGWYITSQLYIKWNWIHIQGE